MKANHNKHMNVPLPMLNPSSPVSSSDKTSQNDHRNVTQSDVRIPWEDNIQGEKSIGNQTAPSATNSVSVLGLQIQSMQEDQVSSLTFAKHNGPPVDFPLDAQEVEALKTTNAVSPILTTDPRVVVTPEDMFTEMGIPEPTFPGDEGFWDEFEAIIDFQAKRKDSTVGPEQFFDLPTIFEGKTMEEAAQAVRADFPSHFPSLLVQQFLQEGAKVDPEVIPQTGSDFVRGPVLLSQLIGWSVSKVSPSAFAAKWNQGRPRPESVAWAVQQGELEAPPHIREKIEAMGLTKPEDFTAYQEGCPRHPSWPAMHSAASSSSLYLAVVMDLSPEQIAEARKLDYAVATSRSLAGVHYESDNLAGLALGEEVVARELPDFLAQFASSPEEAEQIRASTKAKIARIREGHNWLTYEPKAQ